MKGFTAGLSDFGVLAITLGERGTWSGKLLGTTGAMLAGCDSRWA